MELGGKTFRPFSLSAKVKCRSYSYYLQKAIVDFGSDVSFQETQKKLREHYRLELPLSSIQQIVESHAGKIFNYVENKGIKEGYEEQIIVEMDGSMIPVVDTISYDEECQDSRRCRKTRWQEARLCFARGVNQSIPIFYATMGGVERAGDLLYRAAKRVGFSNKTRVHGLGDGAKWIKDQMSRVFGGNVKYLIDFYHMSEYLAKAAEHSWTSEKECWRREKQDWMKESKVQEVLSAIRKRLPIDWDSKKKSEEGGTPVEKCYKYIEGRKNCFDYKEALENNLPIGSGEIESGHRYVIQKRLKIAGAWWSPKTADNMLALRTLRANGDWDNYWQTYQAA